MAELGLEQPRAEVGQTWFWKSGNSFLITAQIIDRVETKDILAASLIDESMDILEVTNPFCPDLTGVGHCVYRPTIQYVLEAIGQQSKVGLRKNGQWRATCFNCFWLKAYEETATDAVFSLFEMNARQNANLEKNKA